MRTGMWSASHLQEDTRLCQIHGLTHQRLLKLRSRTGKRLLLLLKGDIFGGLMLHGQEKTRLLIVRGSLQYGQLVERRDGEICEMIAGF